MDQNTQAQEEISLASIFSINRAMREFYAKPENQARFEEWLAKRKEKESQKQ